MSEIAMKVEKKSENRTGISTQLKERMEQSTGMSLNDVRVHYNSVLPARPDALAYTQENQVEIGPRQEQHLPHELGHVIQQKPKIVHTNGKHEPNIKAVVQRSFDFFALIEGILKIITKEADDLRANLEKFEPKGKPDDMKNLRKLLDEAETLQDSTRQNINKLFFDFYGMEVKHALDVYKARFDLENEGINDNAVMLQDENSLIDALNDIYATETGKELLIRLLFNKDTDKNKGVIIYLEHLGAYSRESTSMNKKDEQLKDQGNGVYVAGPGAGTRVYLGSPALDGIYDINKDLVDKQSIVIAHELIHALHAQEGSMPTWKILLGNNYELTESDYKAMFLHHHPRFKDAYPDDAPPIGITGDIKKPQLSEEQEVDRPTWKGLFGENYVLEEVDYEAVFLHHYPEFKGASADDVPTTGIRKDIVYPQPLENIKHINENRIRSELKMVSRDSY